MAKYKKISKILIKDIFIALFFLFILFSVMELIKPKIVTAYIPINWWFFVVILFGVLAVLFSPVSKHYEVSNKQKILQQIMIILLAVLTGVVLFAITAKLGVLSFLVGISTIIIIYFFININLK